MICRNYDYRRVILLPYIDSSNLVAYPQLIPGIIHSGFLIYSNQDVVGA